MLQMMKTEWECFKSFYMKPFFWVTGISMVMGIVSYFVLVSNEELTTHFMGELMTMIEDIGVTAESTHTEMFWVIFMNNIRAAAIMILLGLVPVIFLPAMSAIITIMSVSVLIAFMHIQGETVTEMVVFGLIPHGVVELPAIFLAGAIGIHLSLSIFRKFFTDRPDILLKEVFMRVGNSFVLLVFPMILVAALIEGYITPILLR